MFNIPYIDMVTVQSWHNTITEFNQFVIRSTYKNSS